MMPNPWQCVAFDFDGTLVDSLPALRRAYEAFLREFGASGSDEEFERLNGPSMSTIVALLRDWHHLAPPHDTLLRSYYAKVEMAYRGSVESSEGAVDLLNDLRAEGNCLALVTSSPRAAVDCVLNRLAWRRCFDVVVCGDDVPEAKPDPAVYHRACELGGWTPTACVAVEDAPAGVQAAAECGMSVIGLGPPERHAVLRGCGAVWTCATLNGVRRALQGEVTRDGIRR